MISDQLTQAATQQPVAARAIKEILQQGQQQISDEFHAGTSARTLIRKRSDWIDQLLRALWENPALHAANATLVAVGGYGRRELHPYSDIDLLILIQQEDPTCSDAITAFVTLLWDLGLQIGHSVRTVEGCLEEGNADITVATNLLEARLLAGSPVHFEQLQQQLSSDAFWPSGPFFVAKCREQQTRLEKYNDTAYNLEPNIKEGPGGLRDIQNILWVTRRHFGSSNPRELAERHFLTEAECGDLEAGQERLWEVRFALHLIAGRAEERLLFDLQPELARHFGHLDSDNNRGVESFMHSYFRIIRELSLLNEMLLQLFEEQLLTPYEERKPSAIDQHFGTQGGYLTLLQRECLQQQPELALSLFLVLRDHPELKGVTAEAIRQIRAARYSINADFRENRENQQRFLQLFYHPLGLTHLLRRMNRYGVLGAYLPEFEKIIGLMQHDLFHAYTVDEHTLFVVRNLRRLTVPEFHHESPQLSQLILQLDHTGPLYLAALFHDIAKGRGGNHSKLGVSVVHDFCIQHQIAPEESEEIAWLVEHHLDMSSFAQRRDIDDPEEVHIFAQLVETQRRLEMLYLLTVADIRATNRTLWNHFKDTLLKRLFSLTTEALKRLHQPELSAERATENRQQALDLLRGQRFEESQITPFWSSLEIEYFQKHDAEEIYWHTSAILSNEQRPVIEIHPQSHHGGSEILIYSGDQRFLFSTLIHTLESLGLDIHAARINTTLDSHALDIFTVLTRSGKTLQDPELLQKIRQRLQQEIDHPTLLDQPVTFRRSRHQKHFHEASKVLFRQDERKQQTLLEVDATNRSGLLSSICRVLMECDIRVQGAKIATLGEWVEDLFWVTYQDNTPLEDPEEIRAITQRIKSVLDPATS